MQRKDVLGAKIWTGNQRKKTFSLINSKLGWIISNSLLFTINSSWDLSGSLPVFYWCLSQWNISQAS